MHKDALPKELAAAIAGGGEAGAMLAKRDWDCDALGPPSAWRPAQRSLVAVALLAPLPIVLWLGPELRLIYNDAAIPLLGERHPAALGGRGREWTELWPALGPLLREVLRTGAVRSADDLGLVLGEPAGRQERFFSFSASPILESTGEVSGVFCPCSETTERVLSERRLQALGTSALALAETEAAKDGYERERERSREEVDLLRERNHALAALATALESTATLPDVLERVRDGPLASLAAGSLGFGIVDRDGGLVRATYTDGLSAEVRDRYHVLSLQAPVPVAEVARSGSAMVIEDTFALPERFSQVVRDAATDVRSACVLPLIDGAECFGAMSVTWRQQRDFGAEELALLGQVAALAARALRRIQSAEREHRIAVELQTRLLALEPRTSAALLSAIYRPATEATRVGGDWYTAVGLQGGSRIAVSVGDVVGGGLFAAAVMGQLRSALGTAALSASDPAQAVDALERYAGSISGATSSTLAYAVVDTEQGRIEYTCAGHPYPLLVSPEGEASFLQGGRRAPLGVRLLAPTPPGAGGDPQEGSSSAAAAELEPGATVVMYTDGLIERRGESLDEGLQRLARAAADCSRMPLASLGPNLLERLQDAGGFCDDVAILAVRLPASRPDMLAMALPVGIEQIPLARRRLQDWLQALELSEDCTFDVLLATGEAVNNAILHGSDGDPRNSISLEAFASAEGVSVSVGDFGSWSDDSAASRRGAYGGRGLTLMHQLSDEVAVQRSSAGTHVTLRFECALQRGASPA